MAESGQVRTTDGGGGTQQSEPAKDVTASPSKVSVGNQNTGDTATVRSYQPSAQGSQRGAVSERDMADNKSILTTNQDDAHSVASAHQSADRKSLYSTTKKEWRGKEGRENMTIKEEDAHDRRSQRADNGRQQGGSPPMRGQVSDTKNKVVSPRGNANKNKPQDAEMDGKVSSPHIVTQKNQKIIKDRDANAQWQSEWEMKEFIKPKVEPYPRYDPNRSVNSRDSDKHWQHMLAERAQGDTQMYKVSTADSASTSVSNQIKSTSKDGVFYPGQLPTSKLGESKQKDVTIRNYGDFHGNAPRKSIRELQQRDVSPQKYGDFYPARRSIHVESTDFMTQLDEESQLRGHQNKSTHSSAQKRDFSRHGSSNNTKNVGDEPYWLVMDLETNKGYRVKKSGTPQSAVRNARSSQMSNSGRGFNAEDFNQMQNNSDRLSPNKIRGYNGNDDRVSIDGQRSKSIDSGLVRKPRAPWESPAFSYNSGTPRKNPDDIFRRDKSAQRKTKASSVDSKAPWEASEIEKKGMTPKKNHDDLFRRDSYFKDRGNTGNSKQSNAPWETPVNGGYSNDFDVMFGKPAYHGKMHMNGMRKSNSIDNGYRSSWETLPPKNKTKAEEYHKMLHNDYLHPRGQGY